MRVCYVCADRGIPLDGHKGAAAHVRGFVRGLHALGHEVRVLTAAPATPPPDMDVQLIDAPATVAAVAPLVPPRVARALGHLWTNVALEQALEATFASFRPSLVYERYSPFSVAGVLAAQRAGVPHVLEVNAPLAWEGSRYRRQALDEAATALEAAVFTAAARIVCVSDELRDWLVAAGADRARISVVPNGVDTTLFTPVGAVIREAPADAIVVGFVGSLKQWHGLDVLAEAFRRVADDARFHLLIIGDGPEARAMQRLAQEYPQRVRLTGGVVHEQIPAYLRGIDIAVAPYPATQEFYFSPLKVLEYMAAGVAVVASDIGQLRALIRSGVTGMLTPPGDVDALVMQLRRLADARTLRGLLGAAAAEEAARAHSWQQRAAQVLELVAPTQRPVPAQVREVACSR